MTHPDWPLFVAAIVAHPDDDTPRLVAADFLDENGDPARAAFIRAQVALARAEASGLSQSLEADELRKKERAFLGPFSVYPHLWAATECPELVRMEPHARASVALECLHVEDVERLTWRRGFVEEVACPAHEWLRHGVSVRKRNPVRAISLDGCERPPREAWYAGLSSLRGLREVQVVRVDEWRADEFTTWLRQWLPGTAVTYVAL